MIRARYLRRGERRRLTLRGHATGSPAVCAAASALLCALAGWLRRAEAPGLELTLRPGDGQVACEGGAAEETAFQIVLTGLAQLAALRPDLVELDREETA